VATNPETTVKIFDSPDRDLTLQPERSFPRAKTLPRNNNLALQAVTRLEWLLRDAKEALAAEIFRRAHDRGSSRLDQPYRPMHRQPLAFAAISM
jgi:hypothetical protein